MLKWRVILRLGWGVWLCWLLVQANDVPAHGVASDNAAPGLLRENMSEFGVRRAAVQDLVFSKMDDQPALAFLKDGSLLVAAVGLVGDCERVYLRKAANADAQFGAPYAVTTGCRAHRPRMAVSPSGAVWLAYSGTTHKKQTQSQVWLVRLDKKKRSAIRLSSKGSMARNPAMIVDQTRTVRVVFEQWSKEKPQSRIAMRSYFAAGLGPLEYVSSGPWDRRPAVAAISGQLGIVWDSLVDVRPTGAADPDFDMFFRLWSAKGFSEVVCIDASSGIQAAGDIVSSAQGFTIAYHTSQPHGLVKWWQIRRVQPQTGVLEELVPQNPAQQAEPSGEQQGGEFPSLAVLPDQRLAVFSRPSQGAYLQLIDAQQVTPVLDLTRRGWGGRGMWGQLQAFADNRLLLVRRARHKIVLERFSLADCSRCAPVFRPIEVNNKKTVVAKHRKTWFSAPALKTMLARIYSNQTQVLFGDLHMHSAMSDATGTADEIIARAWNRGHDFASLSDHDNLAGRVLFPSQWEENVWLCDAFNQKSGFVCLHAYEWTTPPVPPLGRGFGHRNIYFRDKPPNLPCGFRGKCKNSQRLFASLAKGTALAIPHHTAWTGTDWQSVDANIQRQFELISVHGADEHPGQQLIPTRGDMKGMFAIDALNAGLRMGFVGGSDGHGLLWHHGIAHRRDPWSCGLTGVLASRHNRAAIFDALLARQSFATSGAKITLLLRAGSISMGASGKQTAPVVLDWLVVTPKTVSSIELMRDGQVIQALRPQSVAATKNRDGASVYQQRWLDRSVLGGQHYYYLRVVQKQNKVVDMAWSSPVFVDVIDVKKQ